MTTNIAVESTALDGVTRVVLGREPANVFDQELVSDLAGCVSVLEELEPRVVVLTSACSVFSAGADLKSMYDGGWETFAGRLLAVQAALQPALDRWEALPCPTIALINGHALGGGCELAIACDWRLMARGKGRIGFPEVRRGLLAGSGGTQRATRLLGPARAIDVCLRGRMLSADEACAIGLVSTACDPEELESSGLELAAEVAALPAPALAATKRCILAARDLELDAGLSLEREEMARLLASDDSHEGVRSFVERREPRWTHR
jgi:enoyl-CoA hydratase/carnithine racemase